MTELRREREYNLHLNQNGHFEDGEWLTGEARGEHAGPAPSKRYFVASPDGKRLAYWRPESGELHVRDATGVDRTFTGVPYGEYRFSPDARLLALAARDADGKMGVDVVDLDSGERRSLGRLSGLVAWIEWARGGVVALHGEDSGDLTWLPLATGVAMRRIADEARIDRFSAAAAGTRVVFYIAGSVRDVDIDAPGTPRILGETGGDVTNSEMTPDGALVAYSTPLGLWTIQGAAAPRLASDRRGIHTVWFSADGAWLAFASKDGATLVGGSRAAVHVLDSPSGGIRAMRFVRGGPGLVVTFEREVLSWDPVAGRTARLAAPPDGATLDAAEVFDGGTLTWSSKMKDFDF